jgi:hypothetical protein
MQVDYNQVSKERTSMNESHQFKIEESVLEHTSNEGAENSLNEMMNLSIEEEREVTCSIKPLLNDIG